jgi:hypothetical protein
MLLVEFVVVLVVADMTKTIGMVVVVLVDRRRRVTSVVEGLLLVVSASQFLSIVGVATASGLLITGQNPAAGLPTSD